MTAFLRSSFVFRKSFAIRLTAGLFALLPLAASAQAPGAANSVKLSVTVLNRPGGKQVAAQITVRDANGLILRGESKDESAERGDLLRLDLAREQVYHIMASQDGHSIEREYRAGTNTQDALVLSLRHRPSFLPLSMTFPRWDMHPKKKLRPAQEQRLKKAFAAFFAASPEEQSGWKFDNGIDRLLARNELAVRAAAWQVFTNAPIHDFGSVRSNVARFKDHISPYTVKAVGKRPASGWPVFIAMHGGGNAPQAVNDSQWRIMQRYYKDHPELGGYLYVALRAPNNTWNGFYDDYVYPLVENLIRDFILFHDANPNKVFIMGYSHGGYGAFAIGPKMPDRFAAIHASASAPTDGESTPKTLRNVLFTFMIGEKDTAYGRLERCQRFNEELQQLRGTPPSGYPGLMQFIPGNGHTGLPDRDKIPEMYAATRNPVPQELTWLMTDSVIKDFYWLRHHAPAKGLEIAARFDLQEKNHICLDSANAASATLLLDQRMVDFSRPVTIIANGVSRRQRIAPSAAALCRSLLRRGDPHLAFAAEVEVALPKPQGKAAPASAFTQN